MATIGLLLREYLGQFIRIQVQTYCGLSVFFSSSHEAIIESQFNRFGLALLYEYTMICNHTP